MTQIDKILIEILQYLLSKFAKQQRFFFTQLFFFYTEITLGTSVKINISTNII